ncbi:MAG TPA: hypothetical protein VHW09_26350 [Bryobacteraceae bacterium]|nr:hypothetical protein [Bryobacteraceae bacterium]
MRLGFTGTFYLESPVAGQVRGAVFLGQGTIQADPPPAPFDRNLLHMMVKDDRIESDFRRAVLRFSDGTGAVLGAPTAQSAVPAAAQRAAYRFASRLLRQTGANVSARLAMSILNGESPGIFFAGFSGGRLGPFSYLLDFQDRLPAAVFGLDAGESGVIFAPGRMPYTTDTWMAFRPMANYCREQPVYSDTYNQIALSHYDMDIDLATGSWKHLSLEARMVVKALTPGLRAVAFKINEQLTSAYSERLKCAMHVRRVRVGNEELPFAQEAWETGFTVFFAVPPIPGRAFTLTVDADGDGRPNWWPWDPNVVNWSAPGWPGADRSWYPKPPLTNRSTFSLNFVGKAADVVVGPGVRTETNRGGIEITRYSLDTPSRFVTFYPERPASLPGIPAALHQRRDPSGVDIEDYDVSGGMVGTGAGMAKMADDISDTLQFFTPLFGPYPHPVIRGIARPGSHNAGPPTLLLIGSVGFFAYASAGFEAAHQWWGEDVGPRSYRDGWLTQGLAEYASQLYAEIRGEWLSGKDRITVMRTELRGPVDTGHGIRRPSIGEIGPIIEGPRLETSETCNARFMLSAKSTLVIRMLHFLFTDPVSGDDQAFFQMLTAFASRYRWRDVTTEEFRDFASPYFAGTPIGLQSGLRDLNWFFEQWVYESSLPSYRLEYHLESSPHGGVILYGTVEQQLAGSGWVMPVPISIRIAGHKPETKVATVRGPKTEFFWKLSGKPFAVQLDPERWVLSASTRTSMAHRP